MTSQEEWRPVVGYEGHYEVSSQGRMRSLTRTFPTKQGLRTKRGRILAQYLGDNYAKIRLVINYVGSTRYVHRLVAEAFIGPCPEGMEVCHNNGQRQDNRATNLRYDTRLENMRHSQARNALPQVHDPLQARTRVHARQHGHQHDGLPPLQSLHPAPLGAAKPTKEGLAVSLPSSVKVGCLMYRVLTDPEAIKQASDSADISSDAEWSAFSDHDKLIIGVNAGNPEGAQRRDLLREVIHCCIRLSGAWPNAYADLVGKARGRDGGLTVEEFVVAAPTGPMLGVLQDNPAMTAWLVSP